MPTTFLKKFIILHKDFMTNTFEGKVTGKKSRGRPRNEETIF